MTVELPDVIITLCRVIIPAIPEEELVYFIKMIYLLK